MSIHIHTHRFINKLQTNSTSKDINMINFILSNITDVYYGLYLEDSEKKFLNNLHDAIDIDNINDIEISKKLSIYKVEPSDISDILLYILSGGEIHRINKKNTWLERKKVSLIDYINDVYKKINFKLLYLRPKKLFYINCVYIPNKKVDFFIDYINLKGYKSI